MSRNCCVVVEAFGSNLKGWWGQFRHVVGPDASLSSEHSVLCPAGHTVTQDLVCCDDGDDYDDGGDI